MKPINYALKHVMSLMNIDLYSPGGIPKNIFRYDNIRRIRKYIIQFKKYRSISSDLPQEFVLHPCLFDDKSYTEVNHHYFYQDTWGARQVFDYSPPWLVDIGSTALLVGILSQYVKVLSVDIRPLNATLPGLECRKGSITNLPFNDAEVPFMTSLCVLEHIGLGRYGDTLDPFGTAKAAKEIDRVLQPGGHFVTSVTVGPSCVAFNAHRIFLPDEFLSYFPKYEVVDQQFLYPEPSEEDRSAFMRLGDHAVYCVHLRKPST